MKALQAWILLVVICFLSFGCRKEVRETVSSLTITGAVESDGLKKLRYFPTTVWDSADLNTDVIVSIDPHEILKIYSADIVVLKGSLKVRGKTTVTANEVRFTPDHELSPATVYSVRAVLNLETAPNDSREVSIDDQSYSDNSKDPAQHTVSWKFHTISGYRYSMNRTNRWVTSFQRDGNKVVQMGEFLYSYGGWTSNPDQSYNDVYRSSGDLTQWERMPDAPWEGRHTYGIGKIDSTLYVFGGDYLSTRFDVWKTTDGMNFAPVSDNLESLLGPRLMYGACVHNSKLFLLGGHSDLGPENSSLTDIWISSNGGLWRCITTLIPFIGKNISGSVASYNGRLWVVGGGYHRSYDPVARYSNEVYSSEDGITWRQEPDAPWLARQYADLCVWNNRLWMVGGYNEGNLSDIWYMDTDGIWHQFETPSEFEPRHASGVGVYNDKLVIVAGNYHNDCWVIEKN